MPPQDRTFLRDCKIRPGVFDFERFVEIVIDKVTYMTIAHEDDVQEDGALQRGEWTDGSLRVYRVEWFGNDKAFVILPREVLGRGRRLLVPKSRIQVVK